MNDPFDLLIKSRFIEMFGDISLNDKGWKLESLENVATSIGDGLHGTPVYSTDGEYAFINGNNLRDGSIVVDADTKRADYTEYEKYRNDLDETTVLISINGTLGKVAFYNGENVILGKSACFVNLDITKVRRAFFREIIQSQYFLDYIESEKTGTTINNISLKSMRSLIIPIPPLNLQDEFIDFVTQVYQIANIYNSIYLRFEDLVKSRFIEMFGDPDNNPKGFNIKTIKEVSRGKLSYGIAASAVDYDGETRYIRITDIDEQGNLNSDCKSPDEYDEQFLLHEGDILFARSGATVGKTYQYNLAHGKALYAGYLIRSIPDTNVIEPTFLFQSTKTAYYDRCIGLLKRGATQPNINAQQYGDLKIIVPPITLQREFIRFVEQVDKSKFIIQQDLIARLQSL